MVVVVITNLNNLLLLSLLFKVVVITSNINNVQMYGNIIYYK